MPLTTNLQLELFDVWGIDYMGPFPKSRQCERILVVVNYAPVRWSETWLKLAENTVLAELL